MVTWTKRLFFTASFLALITTNILTLTSTAFNAALSGLMSTALGVQTVTESLNRRLKAHDKSIKNHKAAAMKRKAATRKFGTRLASRTKRVAAKSIAAIPAEAVPFLGVGVLIADTGYELYAACETMRELDDLYLELGVQGEKSDDAIYTVCNPDLPEAEDVWARVLARSGEWLDQARAAM